MSNLNYTDIKLETKLQKEKKSLKFNFFLLIIGLMIICSMFFTAITCAEVKTDLAELSTEVGHLAEDVESLEVRVSVLEAKVKYG